MTTDPRDPRGPGAPHDDTFEAELRELLRQATAPVTSHLSVDDVLALPHPAPNRTWARAGAVGLTAAAAVGVLVWNGTEPTPSVGSASTPPPASTPSSASASSSVGSPTADAPTSDPTAASDTSTGETFPKPSDAAVNILVVGVDTRPDCIDPSSSFAGSYPDQDIGSRADAIMILRIDPQAGRAAVLSFPRDLWVSRGDLPSGRINALVVDDDPIPLIATLDADFGLDVDHFVQIDYCGFRDLVDAVGGVTVPFTAPVRDTSTGFLADGPACVVLDGEHALAYVRSRRMEVLSPDGSWLIDGSSDLSRVARQQDLLRRLLDEVLDQGLADVGNVRSLLAATQESLVVDSELTLSRMLEYAGVLTSLRPADIGAHTIDVSGRMISGNSVLVPLNDTRHSQDVLAMFRGERPLGEVIAPPEGDGALTTAPLRTGFAPEPILSDPTVDC